MLFSSTDAEGMFSDMLCRLHVGFVFLDAGGVGISEYGVERSIPWIWVVLVGEMASDGLSTSCKQFSWYTGPEKVEIYSIQAILRPSNGSPRYH